MLNSFTGRELKNLGKLFKIIFTNDTDNKIKTIQTFFELAGITRREGLLALENKVDELDDEFFKKGLRMVVDGSDEERIKEVLYLEIEAIEERHALNASIFSSAGTYAPTLGVLGAVFGLIAAMSNIDDTGAMAEAIAAAFIATILGIFTGYVLWNPFSTKLKTKSKHEILEKNIIVEGLVALQRGESPILIKEKLMTFLPPEERAALDQEGESSPSA